MIFELKARVEAQRKYFAQRPRPRALLARGLKQGYLQANYNIYYICCLSAKYTTCKIFINSVMIDVKTEICSGLFLNQ